MELGFILFLLNLENTKDELKEVGFKHEKVK